MKQKWYWLPLFFIFPAALVMVGKAGKASSKESETGFALVELFTSEGCSSCPAADQLVEKIAEENKGKRVYIASYHVDYWDRLGWKDHFSKPAYSTYQYAYAKQFKLNAVYTPQIVVNGQTQFVGSNGIALRSAIHNRLNSQETVRLLLEKLEKPAGACHIRYSLEGAGTTAALTFVLLQKKAVVPIKAGENGGKTLSHINIVRDVKPLSPGKFSGEFSLNIPADLGNDWELLCYAKDGTTGAVLTAQKVSAE